MLSKSFGKEGWYPYKSVRLLVLRFSSSHHPGLAFCAVKVGARTNGTLRWIVGVKAVPAEIELGFNRVIFVLTLGVPPPDSDRLILTLFVFADDSDLSPLWPRVHSICRIHNKFCDCIVDACTVKVYAHSHLGSHCFEYVSLISMINVGCRAYTEPKN